MEEKYSKEFIDAYKERLRRIWSGETFEYPSIFNSNFVASSATAFVGDDLSSLKGVLYNDVKYKPIGKVVDSFVSEDGFKCTIRREEEKCAIVINAFITGITVKKKIVTFEDGILLDLSALISLIEATRLRKKSTLSRRANTPIITFAP